MQGHHNFTYKLVSPIHLKDNLDQVGIKIFSCWHEVWSKTFFELKGQTQVASDNYLIQDHIGGLFYKDECIATVSHKTVDMSVDVYRKLSYFNNWNHQDLNEILHKGQRVLVCSSLGVRDFARGTKLGIPVKFVVVALMVKYFQWVQADVLATAPRTNRNMHSICYSLGAEVIRKSVPSGHGDLVDLVGFFQSDLEKKKQRHELDELIGQLWKFAINEQDHNKAAA